MKPEQIKQQVDLHELAERLGLKRPQGRGNYHSPHHADKHPSLSISGKNGSAFWKDHSSSQGGSAIDLVMFVKEIDFSEAMNWLHESYGWARDKPEGGLIQREQTLVEYIAQRCREGEEPARAYLKSRGIEDKVIDAAWKKQSIGWNTYTSTKYPPGEIGHGGAGVAFIVRDFNTRQVVGVDTRYEDPALNGGLKTNSQGDKNGAPWCSDWNQFKKAHTVILVESAINALSVECCHLNSHAAIALRGAAAVVDDLDIRPLIGKRVLICMDNDTPFPGGHPRAGHRPGPEAGWALYDRLTAANISTHIIDQRTWLDAQGEPINDINDVLRIEGASKLRQRLKVLEDGAIPGVFAEREFDAMHAGKERVWFPLGDAMQYWRFRNSEDFARFGRETTDKEGNTNTHFEDLSGFRIASLSRVKIASAAAAISGEPDTQPNVMFAVSVQTPRHGNQLIRHVFTDDQLHNQDHWRKFGPIFNPKAFARLITILERAAHLGARNAVNFVGLIFRDGKMVVNEGPDCYFTDPEKQCPYHNLVFPSGSQADARRVISAYQATFTQNAALLPLIWTLGAHLKTFLGFWPHLVMQANKGAGKSVLLDRLSRTTAMQIFSGQSINTEFRILTSLSHTSHPIGWEELSARRQDVIDKAVSMLQEAYNFRTTRRGSEMTEYLISAPVLLAGEDVPVRSLLGKVVRTELSNKKGVMLPHDLPRFPIAEWLKWQANLRKEAVHDLYQRMLDHCHKVSRASKNDDGGLRMAGNYAALLTAWSLVTEFCGMDAQTGDFGRDLIAEMNGHIADSEADREPWVWILETVFSEIDANRFAYPYKFDLIPDDKGEVQECLLVRMSHVIDHIKHSNHLKEVWNGLPVKSATVFKKQVSNAEVLIGDSHERTIDRKRVSNMAALSLNLLKQYGLHVSVQFDERGYRDE